MIKVEGLVKKYGDLVAVNDLNLQVNQGEVFGLLGPNGSGKTTTINCILSLLSYSKGEIQVFGKPMAPDAYDIKRNIGVIMQNIAVFDELTVLENIDYFCGLYINDKRKRRNLVEEAIEFVGLRDYKKFVPKELSGGLLRRLNIACGIAHKPKLIILDEPTVAVDPQSRNNILEGILKLNRDGATIIYTSHYMEEVEQICSRICILDKGSIIASGSKEELKSMIDMGEKVSMEVFDFKEQLLRDMKKIPNIQSIDYKGGRITVKFSKASNNLIYLLDYLKEKNIKFGKFYSELPTLNDVFLELTGKELRD
ncbi:ABC transporter ATP-binding protein [Alkaliphilus pronyensis]